ncbi:hypothetical protein [Methylobacterium organophilum]|uniref:Ankyrin n=1 Tax=Methylobacterium organophilum TaxID=410 RepID=A0ABQ4T6D7_METOR|nr:hypothetical protein [Methylobacterium organophilum]GJE26004.1 hypothetical protein LKMONMHP_0848 [Methylobacterium organophilum]
MQRLPDQPDLDHLKRQAKGLLARARAGDASARAFFRDAARGAEPDLRLHAAQFALARAYGFPSWPDLARFVLARRAWAADPARRIQEWLRLAYAGDIAGGIGRASPTAAARLIEEDPGFLAGEAPLACAVGQETVLHAAIDADPGWVHRPGGPLNLPPLVAVTHSSLLRLPRYRDGLIACARRLLEAGADPDQAVPSRWGGAPGTPLSALYGAAGQNRDPALTRLLLEAGANPNDGESLYHSLEEPECTRLLLKAGARVAGTNALYRALDLADAEPLRLLLAHGADPEESPPGLPTSAWGTPLLWAIRRRRSLAHVEALLAAGADPSARTPDGTGALVLARRFGLPEVAARLEQAGAAAAMSDPERFLAACAAGDGAAAERIRSLQPDLPGSLSEVQLRQLPELAALGCGQAVRLMVRLGWPVAIPGGDWQGSALNHAVFRGDAGLTRFLLEHGADWRERHGYGDDVSGTLSWASLNEPEDGGDWAGCAEALLAHGMPAASRDPAGSGGVVHDGRLRSFSDAVTEILLGVTEQEG